MNIRFPVWLALILALLAALQTNRAANLLINGSFEDPPGIYPYQVFSAGEGAMPGWIIESGTVEITAGTYWQSAEGAQSLDLNGIFESIGTIHQDFATVPGQSYKVRFAYAGNPECGLPTLKTANAYWNELLLTNLSFDITGYNNTNVGWIYYEQIITATSSNSRIRFQATSPTFCGLTLDDVSVTAASSSNGCVAAGADLIGWWPAEGNLDDLAGQLDGTTPYGIAYAPGVVGQAFDFSGNRRVNLPDADALKLTGSLTIEGWVFIRNHGGFILFRGDNRPGLDPYVLSVDGQGRLQFHIESLVAAVNLLTPIPANSWQHVAATLDGSSGDMTLHINGTLAAQANTTVRPFRDLDANAEPAIGIGNHGGTLHNFPFDGLIDELSVYDRALSTAEIQSLHTASSAGKCSGTNPPPQSLSVPVIAGFNPISATIGSTVTIVGTNFSPAAAENIVFFGAVRAAVTAAGVNSLSVLVPTGATYASITLSVSGLVAYASQPFQPTFIGNGTNITTDSFAPRFDLASGDGAHRSVIADLDGDGKPDLTVADVYGHTISLFRNISSSGTLSNGSFAPRVVLPAEGGASDNPYGIVVADVDADGKPDIVVCDRLGNNVSVYRNIASPGNLDAGSFAPHVNFAVGADPRYARVADLDGDGRADIVTANYAANTVSILRNIGSTGSLNAYSFAPAVSLPAGSGPYDIAVGDLDGDGKPDLAVVCTDGPTLSLYRNVAAPGALTADSFAPRVDLEALAGNDTIALGDLDGDGKSDLVFGSYQSRTMSVYRNQSSPGAFTTSSFAPRVDFSNGNWTHSVALSDLNGDGKTDIATVGELDSYLSVYENLSTTGSFTNSSLGPRIDFGAGWNAWGLSIGDLDGDGRPDMVFCNAYDDTVSIYQNLVAFTNAPPPQTNDCVLAPAGLVGWWRAEGNGTDFTSTHDGSFPYGIAYSNGVVGEAFDFDGSARRVTIPDDPAFVLTNAMTLEAWVYPRAYGGFITFRGDNRGGLDNWFLDTYQPGHVNFGIIDEANNASMALAPLALNQWQHVAATWDRTAGEMKIYVNGVLAGQTNTALIPVGVLDPGSEPGIGIGNHAGNFHQFPFNGLIDELAIYSRALSAAEVAAIHAAGSLGKCITNTPPTNNCVAPASGLVSWWPGAQTAADVVSGNHGALGGDATFDMGMVGQGFAFDGIGDGVNLGNPASLQLQDFTIEAWIQRGSATICSLDQDLGPGGVMLSYGYGGYGFGVFDNGELFLSEIGISYVGSPLTVTDTNYHHVAVTKSGGEVVFFLDGAPAPAAAYNPTFAFTTEAAIGAVSADRRNSFLGRVDELAVYSRALSAAEVAAIHAAGSLGKCITNTPPTNTCVAAPAGLVSSWRMEGDGSDSADGNHGTLLNGAGFAAGKVGQALSLDGINDHFRVADHPNLRLTNGLSVEAWIFPTSLGGNHCIMSKWDAVVGPDQRSFTVGLQPDGRAFLGLSPNGIEVGATVFSTNSVPLNQWTYLAVTYDGGALRIYLNGVVHDQTPYTQGIFPGTSDIGMGANVGGTAAGDVSSPFAALFEGMIDEPGIYNRALSASEISAIYNAGSAGKCVVSNPPPPGPILAGPITNSANGHQYYLLDATNWPAAEEIAVSLGGHLVTINDAAENGWVFTNFSNFGGVERPLWMGLTDQASEGNWQWISGDPSSYRNWSPIEPNNGGGYFPDEDHALIWHPSAGYPLGSWNDAPSNQLWYAVVEIGPVSPPVQPILAGPITNSANGHWYYLLTATNWQAAQQIARSLGGHLATINDAGENNWVFVNFGSFGGVERDLWIGLTDSRLEGNWRWINGQSASYRNWASGEPNSGGGSLSDEDYAMIWNPSAYVLPGSWNDAPGPQHNHGVVEIAPPVIQGPGMRMTGASGSTTNAFRLQFAGEPGQVYFIEATCDWVNWENLGVAVEIGNGSFEFIDTDAWRYPGRFYRTVSP